MHEAFDLPSNIKSEQALLGAILTRNETLYALPGDFTVSHFHEPLHQRIFSRICEGIDKGSVVDAITLKNAFDGDPSLADIGGGAYLIKLVGASISVLNAADYARHLIDLAERRRLMLACQEAIRRAMTGADAAGEIISQLAGELDTTQTGRYRVSTEREATEALIEAVKTRTMGDMVPTGLAKLDSAMEGGMFQGKLYGIVARKKMGKTMLAGTISNHLQAAGVKHIFLALEMGRDEIHQRSMAARLNCFESAFRTGFAETAYLNRMADYARSATNSRFYVDAPGLSFSDLKHLLPLYIRRYGIKGFVLDCWQLVKGKPAKQSTAEFQDDVAQWLAECCKRHKVFGLVTAQENQDENTRGGEGIRLACDQLYRLCKNDEGSTEAWLEMMETRYTKWQDVGSKTWPSLRMSEKGTHYEQVTA